MDRSRVRAAGGSTVIVAICSLAVPAPVDSHAANLGLAWDPGASGTAGYTVYSGETTGTYSNRNDVGPVTNVNVQGLVEGGTYFFTVTAYDAARLESGYSNEVSVTIPYAPPVVNFSASPTSGTSPVTVTFSNTTTGEVTAWAWSFGDGETSSGPSPTHVYSAPGDYWVTLKATGPGGSASKTLQAAIRITAPTATTTTTKKGKRLGQR